MIKTNIIDDAKAMIDFTTNNDHNWNNDKYSTIDTFSHENLTEVCNIIDLKDKNILSTACSGDQYINFMLNNAKKVDTFDINIFNNYYQNLKIEALKKLNYNDFLSFFVYHKFDKETYMRFNEDLDMDTKLLFDVVFKYNDKKSIYYSNLFRKNDETQIVTFKNNDYLRKQKYEIAQEKIIDKKCNFSLNIIEKIPYNFYEKYDVIYLSNLIKNLNYAISKENLNKYHDYIVNKLSRFLTDNGQIISYIPEYNDYILSNIFNDFDLEKIDNNNYNNKQDGVLIYTKKR